MNPHVQTYWSKCALCHLNFTVIGKTETSAEDFRYITTKAKLLDSLPADMDLNSSSGGSTEKLAKQYFSTLRKGEVEELYKYYKFDFEAFGYDYSEYLDVAKADKWDEHQKFVFCAFKRECTRKSDPSKVTFAK